MSGTKVPRVAGNPNVSYHFRIDANGDARQDADVAIRFGRKSADGSQPMTVKVLRPGQRAIVVEGRSTGFGHPVVVNRGPMAIRAFAGRRDDPFFFNLVGFLNILDLGGKSFVGCGSPTSHPETDTFTGQNVSSIVVELPSSLLDAGGDSKIGVWATTNVGDQQIDRMGSEQPVPARPRLGRQGVEEDDLQPREPGDRRRRLERRGRGHPPLPLRPEDPATGLGGAEDPADDAGKIASLAGFLLPDVLTVDVSSPAGFPNGRRPADDVIDTELGLGHRGLRHDRLRRLERRGVPDLVPLPRGAARNVVSPTTRGGGRRPPPCRLARLVAVA